MFKNYYEFRLRRLVKEAIDSWYHRQSQDPFTAFYLYYTEAIENKWGTIAILESASSPWWVLAWPERISPAWTVEYAFAKVLEICQRLPIIGPDIVEVT